MAHPDPSCRLVLFLVVALWATPACKALFYDLDDVPLRSSDTAPPTDTDPPLSDTSDPRDSDATPPDTGPPDTRAATDGRDNTDTTAPDPASSCLAVASCGYLTCPDLTDQCLDRATRHGDRAVRSSAEEVLVCSRDNDCDFYFRLSCTERYCGDAAETCLGEKPSGDNFSCFEIVNCRRQCGEASPDCPADCKSSGSVRGRRRFDELNSCIEDKCQQPGSGGKDECLRTECADEFEKCMGCP